MNDDYTPEPEPEDEPPLDLDEIEATYAVWSAGINFRGGEKELRESVAPYTKAAAEIRDVVPQMLAELRWLRSYVDGLHANRVVQYVITDGPEPGTASTEMATREQIDEAFARPELGKTPWVRDLLALHWTRLSKEPPF
ncbi:hypothetical protein ACWDA3_25940 [Nonomuraea rubra]